MKLSKLYSSRNWESSNLATLYFKDCAVNLQFMDESKSLEALMYKEVVPYPHSGLIKGILKYTDYPKVKLHLKFRD